MEGMAAAGKTKAIGVSNFTQDQLQHLISVSQVVPAANQVEVHPYLGQQAMLEYCESCGIRVMVSRKIF
eukprot:SAG31_NODE_8173_length_1503_cov_1.425926_3_plen_69_part_00